MTVLLDSIASLLVLVVWCIVVDAFLVLLFRGLVRWVC